LFYKDAPGSRDEEEVVHLERKKVVIAWRKKGKKNMREGAKRELALTVGERFSASLETNQRPWLKCVGQGEMERPVDRRIGFDKSVSATV